MKRLLYCLLAASLFFSCKPKTLVEEFGPIVQGVWVKKDYIDKVLAMKSPAAVPQSMYDITVMNIISKDIKNDTLTVRIGKSSHEINYVRMEFIPGKKPHSIVISDADLTYRISGQDTIITLSYMLHGKPDSTEYIKALHSAPKIKVGMGLNYMLNKNLFAGKYSLKDSTGTTKEVEFTNDGKVKGLAKYQTYYVNNDFLTGMNNVDGLTFDMDSKKPSGLAFKIKADTLDLYSTYVNDKTEQTTLLGIKYHLVRKK